MRSKKKKRLNLNSELNFKSLLTRCVLFSIIFLIISVILCLICTFIMYNTKNSTSLIQTGAISSLFLSTVITSYAQSKVNKQYYLLGGIILGIIIFLVTATVSLIIAKGNITADSILLKTLVPAFSVIGSVLGVKKEKRRKKYRL